MRPESESMINFDTTHWLRTSTLPALFAASKLFSALYLACTGHMGEQLELPWHRWPEKSFPTALAGRYPRFPLNLGFGMELRATGMLTTRSGYWPP
jgi:hypothetical protein